MKKYLVGASVLFLSLLFFVALFAPSLAPHTADDQNLNLLYASPSLSHWFGNDALGRDLLSRLILGCRVSMLVALLTALASAIIGGIYGAISGYFSPWLDRLLMELVNIFYTLPSLLIIILVMLITGRSLGGILIALTLTGWLGMARLMRAQVLSFKKRPFVEAARATGQKPFKILFKHILPNALAPLIIELSYQIPNNILAEAFLSFLGIGIRPPTPSWGILAAEGWRSLRVYPHLSLFPGLLIFATIFSFNILGDALRDKLDPYLRRAD